ncbi:hypothetical protein RYB01_01655 [Pseudomonas syringae]|nr:hypothetical protein [Pseudomonas syringae]
MSIPDSICRKSGSLLQIEENRLPFPSSGSELEVAACAGYQRIGKIRHLIALLAMSDVHLTP